MRQKQALRQWKLLINLESRRFGMTVEELADELKVNKRTIYRDLATLQEAGFIISSEKIDGKTKYFLSGELGRVKDLTLSSTELLALYLSQGILSQLRGTIFQQAIEQLLEKIKTIFPESVLEYFQDLETNVFVEQFQRRAYEKKSKQIKAVFNAIRNRNTLKMRYFSPTRGELDREVDPYCLWIMGDSLYLIGFCHINQEIRTFLVDRIKQATCTKKRFKPRDHFDFRAYTQEGFRVMRSGDIEDFELKFSPQISYLIEERTWHPTQKLVRHKDGSLTLKFRSRGMDEVKSWVLSFGNLVEVKKPESLRKAVKETAEKILEIYC